MNLLITGVDLARSLARPGVLAVIMLLGFLQAYSAGGDNTLHLITRIDHLDTLAREPMVVRHESGALFVAGYPSQVTGTDWTTPPLLWRSENDGATWNRVDVGSTADGAQGNSDVDLTIGADGTLYFLSMGFNRSTRAGTHIAVGVSHDVGETWQWHMLSATRFDDRPWIRVSPNGTVHVIWNDGGGVRHSTSPDSGDSWAEQESIHSAGGSSHLAVGPQGEIAVRISPISASANKYEAEVDFIAISRDDGQSWIKHPPPVSLSWDPTSDDPQKVPRWVEPLAWGVGHRLWHLWSEGAIVKLGWSDDYGESWQAQEIAHEEGVAFFPYMVAGATGQLAATWFVDDGENLAARVALIGVPTVSDAQMTVSESELFTISAYLENTEKMVQTPAGEYLPVIFLPDGRLAVVSPVQDSNHDSWGFTWWTFGRQ